MRPVLPILVALLLAPEGCAPADGATRYSSVLIEKVPHIRQRPDFCGEACVAMALRRLGHKHDQDDVFAELGVDPLLGRGAVTKEMVKGLKSLGFDVGAGWYHVRPSRAARELDAQFKALHADLKRNIPSILCMHYDESPGTTEHFRLVLGYDAKTDEVIYNEPAEANGAYRRMPRAKLLRLWPLKYRKDRWLAIRMRLEPRSVTPLKRVGTAPHTPAGYAQHIRKLRRTINAKKLKGHFTVVIERPFVVLGDEPAGVVRRRARSTVRWSVERLKQAYFPGDPRRIITIWLFRNRRSYLENTVKLTGRRPGTPFGFYSAELDAMIMNIDTGGGTLVHEIVHPFVEANFPEAPAWLNEGLGSLYEACGEQEGKIVGYTNWRLPHLQEAIRRGTVPSFRWLTSRTSDQFYQQDPGTNYGQSRYLTYYLQEKGLLGAFYRRFRAARAKDPTGFKTLQQVLGAKDMNIFKAEWERFVLALKWQG